MTDSTGDRDNRDLGTTKGRSVAAQRLYDPDGDEELTTVLIYAIAEARDVDPKAVTDPTLYECVDVASLEAALFRPSDNGDTNGSSMEFFYDDLQVEVSDDGWITVSEPEAAD